MRAIDDAHTARAELAEDVVVSDRLPEQGVHGAPGVRWKGGEAWSVLFPAQQP
jgi:hypothetical protein